MKNRKTKKGFTIVELVIVIAVIGILSAILIPTFVNLTANAQEAAKKQQVSDAYTAYILEATDNNYDLYKKEGAGTEESPFKYTLQTIKLAQKVQDKIAIKLGSGESTEWFTYSADKGWEKGNEPSKTHALVCLDTLTNPLGYDLYQKDNDGFKVFLASTETAAQEKLSTFNGAVIYYYTVE